jgi:hypothetical protein
MALTTPSGKGIEKVAKRFCVETAVYWGNPQNDGYGGFTFDTPVEIKCRWEEKSEVNIGWFSTGFPGNLLLSKASVLVLQDLDLQGYLYRGTLASLSGYDTSKPKAISNAYIIHRFDRIPMVRKTDEFVRTAWLYDQGK